MTWAPCNAGTTCYPNAGVTLTNHGGVALSIASMTLGGTSPSVFAISYDTCGSSLAAGATCDISATFTPPDGNSYGASIILSDSASDSPQCITLSATGVIPPAVTTLAATSVTSSGAVLNGTVNPENQGTVYYFTYLANPNISVLDGTHTPIQRISAGAGYGAEPASASISGLAANTTYYYAIVATGPGGGYTISTVLTFTTP